MPEQIFTDENGIKFKKVGMEQFDSYDYDNMEKKIAKYDKRIGSLLISFSELEQTLDQAASFIISDRSDDIGKRITMDMSYIQKVELYNRLLKSYLVVSDNKKHLAKLKKCIDDLKSAGRIRNLVAHAKWMSLDEESYVRSRASLDEEAFIEYRYYKLTPAELYRLERRIDKIDGEFYDFISKLSLI